MIVQCCVCNSFIREKEPLENKEVSHTYCKKCLKKEEEKLEEFLKKLKSNYEITKTERIG